MDVNVCTAAAHASADKPVEAMCQTVQADEPMGMQHAVHVPHQRSTHSGRYSSQYMHSYTHDRHVLTT